MTDLDSTFRSQRKAELHAHLNGCVPTHVIQELLREYKVAIPAGFDPASDLQITKPVASLLEYFRPWNLLKLLPLGRPCLDRMILSALAFLKADGIDYVELRNSPFSIARQNGISLELCLNWIADSLIAASAETGVDARLIPSLSRHDCTPEHGRQLLDAIKLVNKSHLIVGLDLSGDEDKAIDGDFSRFFREGKEGMGLGISIHAGETFIPANVEWAIAECGADRIGHCLAAAKDPSLMDLLLSAGTCVEVCLSSNLLTGRVVSIQTHPVRAFIDAGLPFVLCTDNPSIHNVPLSREYALFAEHFPQSNALDAMYETQIKYSFGRER